MEEEKGKGMFKFLLNNWTDDTTNTYFYLSIGNDKWFWRENRLSNFFPTLLTRFNWTNKLGNSDKVNLVLTVINNVTGSHSTLVPIVDTFLGDDKAVPSVKVKTVSIKYKRPVSTCLYWKWCVHSWMVIIQGGKYVDP